MRLTSLKIRIPVVLILFALIAFLPSCAKKKIYSEPGASAAGSNGSRAGGSDRYGGGSGSGGIDEQALKGGSAAGYDQAGGAASGSSLGGSRESLVSEDIYFEFDSAVLIPEAREILKTKADWLRSNSGISIIIEGHTDDRGTPEYNIALGDRRAESVRLFLESLGVASSRMDTVSFGEERPADPGQNETAWAKNRRVHIEIAH
ncbi:MAG: peptidoglycan-associated lipoprotein Pal [Desulfatirhabdiaceae bacterium]